MLVVVGLFVGSTMSRFTSNIEPYDRPEYTDITLTTNAGVVTQFLCLSQALRHAHEYQPWSQYLTLLLSPLTARAAARAEVFMPGHLLWHALVWSRNCGQLVNNLIRHQRCLNHDTCITLVNRL